MRPLAPVRYLLTPLSLSPLLAIAYFAIALTIAEQVGVLGIAMFYTVGVLFLSYSFAMLDHVLEGRREPLVLATDMAMHFGFRATGVVVVVALFYYFTGRLEAWTNPQTALTARLVAIGLSPAMLGAVGMSGRLRDALDPLTVVRTVTRMASGYLALVAVLVAIWAIPILVITRSDFSFSTLWRAESFLPLGMIPIIGLRGVAVSFLSHIVMLYLWLATFACIGGALYESRLELDYDAAVSPERTLARENAEMLRNQDRIFDHLYAQSRGPMAILTTSVNQLLSQAAQPIEECRWLYARAGRLDDPRLADHLARLLIPMLLKQKATGEALQITRERLAASANFRPQSDAELATLVELARAAGDRATARQLLAPPS